MTAERLLIDSHAKLRAAFELVFASAASYQPFVAGHIYSPQEREPYNALSDRFLRAFRVESEILSHLGTVSRG